MAWVKYFLIKENWMEDWPCALVGADDKDKELLKFLEKHQIDYGYKCNEKIPSFSHIGISWYCHEKSAKKVHKKFNITEVHTDKEQLKQQKVKEDELKKQMKTEEWLLNKLQLDGSKIFGRHKRLKFAQELKEMNTDIAKTRLPKAIQKLFDQKAFVVGDDSIVHKGESFKVNE